MRPLFFIICFLFLSTLFAQEPARIIVDTEDEVHPWNHLKVNNPGESFQFVIVTDRTGGLRPGIFPQAIQKINLLQPEFVMSVGDLISGYTTDSARIDREWDEFQGFIEDLQMPFFYVPGNHDYINDVMEFKWRERFGKDYYHFVYKDVLFLCLNTEEQKRGSRRGYIGETQLEYIRQVLAENQEVKWTLVFMHQPLWDQEEDPGVWPQIEELLAPRKHSVFVGHRHRYVKYERNNGKYFVLATTGGGSALRGPRFGEFDHVVWVSMTEEGPIIANLMLDGIWDENVNTEAYYQFAGPLMSPQNILVEPYFSFEKSFSGYPLEVKLQNPSDVPMLTQLEFSSSNTIWAAQSEWYDTIPPNSTEVLSIPLLGRENNHISQLTPIKLNGTFTYLPAGQPQLEVQQSISFLPQYVHPLSKAGKKVIVDGDPKEWSALPFSIDATNPMEADPFSHRGSEDLSARFGIQYDKKFVFLMVEVQDDDIEISSDQPTGRQDGVFVTLDPRDKSQSAINTSPQGTNSLIIGVSPEAAAAGKGRLFRPLSLPEGTQTHYQKTDTGYRIEIGVPVNWLNQKAGRNWKNLRLNILINDYDSQGAYISRLYWTPDWNSKDHLIGSGTFERQ